MIYNGNARSIQLFKEQKEHYKLYIIKKSVEIDEKTLLAGTKK